MRQIILVRSTYSPFGGVERVAIGLAMGLLEKGATVILLTMPGQSWPIDHPNLHKIEMGVLRTHRLVQAWSFNRAVTRYLENTNADIVFSLDKVTCFTHLHAGGGTHKTFLRIKNSYSSRLSGFLRRFSLFHNYILYIEKKGFRNPLLQKVRCNSRMVKTDIQQEYNVPEDKLTVVHSGIRWQEMADTYVNREKVGDSLVRQHQLDPRWRMLLFLGSGFDRKGLDAAIQGLATLPPAYHLIVVGKGKPEPYLKLAASLGCRERIHFCGPQVQGWRYASFCDALVLPSYYDPFGGAAAEGHAMGIPVLVSDKTGYADWVENGVNGVIVPTPLTPERMKQGFGDLMHLVENPAWTPEQFRKHARNVDDDVILESLLTHFLSA